MECNPKTQRIEKINILELNDEQKVQRLWLLFNKKILDLFVRQCEQLEMEGIDLSKLGNLKPGPKDLKVQFQSMKRAYQIAMQDINLAKSTSGEWKEIKIDNGHSLSFKTIGTVITLRGTGVVDLNIKHLCYAAYLIKHYTSCIPFCKQAKDIVEPSPVEKVAFIRLSIPVPLIKDRSCLVRGLGFSVSSKPKNTYIVSEGISHDKEYLDKVKVDPTEYMKGRQLFDLKHCAMEVRRLNSQLIEYSALSVVDHHVPYVPDAVTSFVIKQFVKFLISNLINQLRNFQSSIWGKELKDNYKENQKYYEWLDEAMAQQFDEKQ